MDKTLRLCKDCKWVVPNRGLDRWVRVLGKYESAHCAHSKLRKTAWGALVSGVVDKADLYPYCTTMRMFDCGITGKYWEPKNG